MFNVKMSIIGRSGGRSAVASAAYRARTALDDATQGRRFDYSQKTDLLHSAIMLPHDAPEELADRATLWNTVEAGEKRVDAQLAREFAFSLPRELPDAELIELARSFVQETFVERGMIADVNIHKPRAKDGGSQPHAHVMLTMRSVGPGGFGNKERSWNRAELATAWREELAVRTNRALAAAGLEKRVDHRSLAERGIALKPQVTIGWQNRAEGWRRSGHELRTTAGCWSKTPPWRWRR